MTGQIWKPYNDGLNSEGKLGTLLAYPS